MIAQMFRELARDIQRAIQEAVPWDRPAEAADGQLHMARKLVAACREFRSWALGHKDEFALLFGVPLPGFDDGRFDVAQQCAIEFAGTFYALFLELWHKIQFPVPAPSEIDPGLRGNSAGFATHCAQMPHMAQFWYFSGVGSTVRRGVDGGVRPSGLCPRRPVPMFELTLGDLARLVGLEYPLPET